MKVKIIITFLVVIAGFLVFRHYSVLQEQSLHGLEPEIGLSFPGAKEFFVRKSILRKGDKGASWSIEAVKGGRLLKLEITSGLDEQRSSRVVAERLAMIKSLYSNLPAPYPGMVTNTIAVDDALEPRAYEMEVEGARPVLYVLPGNARYTYGAMNRDAVAYISGLCFLYDSTAETLYRMDFFVPREEFRLDEMVSFYAAVRSTKGLLAAPGGIEAEDEAGVVPASPGAEPIPTPLDDDLLFKDYNLILIALEPLGAGHVSSYGYDKQTTPAFDAFAAEAFLFDEAVSPASWSLPVFMSWFTSLYPSQHKVTNKYRSFTEDAAVPANLSALSPGVATLAQVFRQNGYRTAGFTGGASLSGDFGFELGFEEYFDDQSFGGFDLTMPGAIDWLTKHESEKVFLFVQGYDTHGAFPLERKYLRQFLSEEYNGPLTGSEEEYWELRNRNIEEGGIAIAGDDMRFLRAVYDAKIYAADQRLGAFLGELRELGLLERSIVVISSGSGNEYNEHGRFDHGFSLYEELVHVPLLLRIPGFHGRIPGIVRTIDIMPTVIDLLGLKATASVREQMQGVSLLPLLRGEALDLKGVSETDYLGQVFKRSIRTGDGWKLIVSMDTEERELYYLKDDPGEQENLVQENGRIAYELEQELFGLLQPLSR